MSTVLYIKANPKSDEESRTFQISEHFIETYKKNHPEDQVITLDLYKEDIHFFNEGRYLCNFWSKDRGVKESSGVEVHLSICAS